MKSIGKYQVIEELGVSATGKTYRARDTFRNREFAVKILQVVPGLTAEAKERFCAHLAACAELTHRHIAKIHDLGELDEGIFVATEWRSGTDLRRFLEDHPDLPLDQKLGVIAQVAEGLGFAHSRGIAHGNLKPSNLFVDASRDTSILDFGQAKWIAALLDAGCRPEGLVAHYLAPEQVLGQPFDSRSDIFALGLMLYECVAGKYPFPGDPGLIPREIVHGEPEPLRRLNPQAPEELEQLIVRALKKNPEQRLGTAEEFASGLYLAAQHFRRASAPAASSDPISQAPLAPPPAPNQPVMAEVPPAPAQQPEAFAPATAFALPVEAKPVAESPVPKFPQDAPPVRERPQDSETESRPWTARSYAAATPLPPTAPKPSANRPPQYTPDVPAFEPPQSFLRPAALPPQPPAPKLGKTAKRVAIAVVGLILAIGILGALMSRQNLRASQNRRHPAVADSEPVIRPDKAAPPPAPAPAARTAKREEPQPVEAVNPEVSAKQVLNGPVRTLWESGRYAQALALVNQILVSDPANEEARSWKTKIREAQAAEAALK